MHVSADIQEYLSLHSTEMGARILSSFPPLQSADDALSPLLGRMLRRPYPAQALGICGVSKRWKLARNANVIAECGAGKTLIALGACWCHSAGKPFSALVMAPPHLTQKWARETFLTLPRVRVFLIDDMRNGGDLREPHGINEVRLRTGARSCAKECILRFPSCVGWDEVDGENCARKAPSFVLEERRPSSPISGSTATGRAVREGIVAR
jgi:hypothetical protein